MARPDNQSYRPDQSRTPRDSALGHQRAGVAHDETSPGDRSVSAIIGATTDEHCCEGFYGSASAGTFLQRVKKLVEHKLSEDGRPSSLGSGLPRDTESLPVPPRDPQEQYLDYILPSRRSADSLMTTYWRNVHILYPYLDEIRTRTDYEKIWSTAGSVSDEKSFLCLLNVIFAISSQLVGSTGPGERDKVAATFYQRAKTLLNVLDTPCLRSVQTYLLLGLYFQSTNDPHACWIFVGLGIRTAQSLGLHLPETSERVSEGRAREMLRKVWYGCVLMDRVLSMTYGRPCMIGPMTAIAVPLPLAADEEPYLSRYTQRYPEQTSHASVDEFYISALKLYEILHDVLFNLYRTDDRTQPIDDVYDRCFGSSSASIFEIDRRLSRWEESIPDRLKARSQAREDAGESAFHRQAVVLRQQ